jgi:hypothetical protein
LKKANPSDTLALYYETISHHFAVNGVPQHWDGVQLTSEK